MERAGYAIEWEDEWITSDADKAYRTSPDSYDWQPYYWPCAGYIVGGDEIENEESTRDSYLDYLTNNPNAANLFYIDFESLGWRQHEGEFETGFHPGQTDDPRKVFAALEDKYDVIFDLHGGASQFYSLWRVWIKDKDAE